MIQPLVSVVIPTYNAVKYIHRAVSSVFAQTYTKLEIIVVDDGSADATCETVAGLNDARIKVVRQKNAGAGAARNRGIAEAKGEYVAFLDADDEWDPQFMEAVVRLTELYPAAGIYSTGFRMVFPEGRDVEVTLLTRPEATSQLVDDYFWRAAGNGFIQTSGVVVPRSLFADLGVFSIGLADGEDLEMWTRIALRHPLAYDSRIMFSYYQTGTANKPRFAKSLKVDPVLRVLRRVDSQSKSVKREAHNIRLYMSRHFRTMGDRFIRTTDRASTASYIDNNDMRLYGISGQMLGRIPGLWLWLRFVAFLSRVQHSRVMLRVLGGRRTRNGSSVRLGRKPKPSLKRSELA
jgi:glycosyltransferase involved in cell wall biosynthesis